MTNLGRRTGLLAAMLLGGCGGAGGGAAGGGQGIIYYSNIEDISIWQVTLADGKPSRLITGNDADRTAQGTFVYEHGDLEESADGVTVRAIVEQADSPPGYNNSFASPRVSPDGSKVAYQSILGDVYVVDRQSGAPLSSFPAPALGTQRWLRPSWTQDGRIVVAGGFSNPGLFISDAGFSSWTRFDPMLASPSDPSVSPDGKRVAFIVNQHVAVMGLDGSGFKILTGGDHTQSLPAWSPDGSRLGAWSEYTLLMFDAADGGNLTDLLVAHPETSYDFSVDLQLVWR